MKILACVAVDAFPGGVVPAWLIDFDNGRFGGRFGLRLSLGFGLRFCGFCLGILSLRYGLC